MFKIRHYKEIKIFQQILTQDKIRQHGSNQVSMVTCFFLEPSSLCRLRAFENFINPKLGMQTSSLKLSTFVLISVKKNNNSCFLFIKYELEWTTKVRLRIQLKNMAPAPAILIRTQQFQSYFVCKEGTYLTFRRLVVLNQRGVHRDILY